MMVLMDKVLFRGLDWREIKSWCPIEWMILGKTFLAKGIVPQEPSDIWDEICTSLHWNLGGRFYEGWIQCLLMVLLGSLHDAPCVNQLICDPRITVIESLEISRGCFREVYCDGTSFTV